MFRFYVGWRGSPRAQCHGPDALTGECRLVYRYTTSQILIAARRYHYGR